MTDDSFRRHLDALNAEAAKVMNNPKFKDLMKMVDTAIKTDDMKGYLRKMNTEPFVPEEPEGVEVTTAQGATLFYEGEELGFVVTEQGDLNVVDNDEDVLIAVFANGHWSSAQRVQE